MLKPQCPLKMKPITFESIRNFLKTKKKSKKDGADTSFKRSDSFKRISIRKSYLDRGRNKRAAALRASSKITNDYGAGQSPHTADHSREVKHGVFVGRPLVESYQSSRNQSEDCLLKNKSLQEINEICGGDEGGTSRGAEVDYDIIGGAIRGSTAVGRRISQTEVQTVAINVQDGNSTESIYYDLNNEETCAVEQSLNVSQVIVNDTDEDYNGGSQTYSELKMIDEDDDCKSNISNNSFYVVDEIIYDKADAPNVASAKHGDGSVSVVIDHRAKFGSRSSLDHTSSWKSVETTTTSSVAEQMPSLVTFKTYCEPKMYLETCFDNVEPHSIVHQGLTSSKINISRTSLNKSDVSARDIDSHTYKMPRAKPVVIRIPAISEHNRPPSVKPNLGKQISNDSALDCDEQDIEDIVETSQNGKFTYEIYKELQKIQPPLEPYQSEDEGDSRPYHYENDRFTYDDDDEQREIDRFDNELTTDRQKSPTSPHNLEESFCSLQMDEKSHLNASATSTYFEPDMYDVLSPDDSIPYPIRIKTNPFTRQKELYSVNLGRIWKQLNLGQEEDLSLEGSSMQGNFKLKNESFKSMSSRDSGFSLTLTKPKNLFRRKSKKGRRKPPKLSMSRDGYFKRVMVVQQNSTRRKKKKPTKQQPLIENTAGSSTGGSSSNQPHRNVFNKTFYETFGRYYRDSRRDYQYGNNYNDNDIFMREFEEFCIRRNQTKNTDRYKSKNFDEFFQPNDRNGNDRDVVVADDDVDKFTQEISDLEAFFEEHLKRLKDYYLQKKQLNERTINELYHDYDQPQHDDRQSPASKEQQHHQHHRMEDSFDDTYMLGTMYDTLKRKQQMYLKNIDIDGVEHKEQMSPLHPINATKTVVLDDFTFPYPDKRSSIKCTSSGQTNASAKSPKRNKFQIHEVRHTQRDLTYASLEFQHSKGGRPSHHKPPSNSSDQVPYADLQFPVNKEFLDFPYGILRSSKQRGASRRKMKSPPAPPVPTEISLSAIFPSVGARSRHVTDDTCQICYKQQKSAIISDGAMNDGSVDRDSDEFSENEFIANSIGCEICLNCDNMYNECACLAKEQPKKQQLDSKWCSCNRTADDRTNFIFGSTNKRKVKRKKSKRRVGGKNHSTLRRGYSYNTSKYRIYLQNPK